MPAQLDLSKLSVTQFAERFRGEMIPLSNTFSYFCASVPMSEEDLKEYLEEPVAALPPAIARALPKISILLVPYLERGDGHEKRKTALPRGGLCLDRAASGRALVPLHATETGRGDGAGLRAEGSGSGGIPLPLLPSAGDADGGSLERRRRNPLHSRVCAMN